MLSGCAVQIQSIRDRWLTVKNRTERFLRPGQGTLLQSFAARLNIFTLRLMIFGALLVLLVLGLELADRVTMKRDLEIAREIQGWLVPKTPPPVAGTDIAFVTLPANTVSGDYYDAFLRPAPPGQPATEHLLLVVADVAGKSVPAALLMATFHASLRTLAINAMPLEELVSSVNRYTCAHSLGGLRFTTAFLADLDTTTGILRYINAG
ncbi:MAG: SpoIIE family protein phosphatase, partial [Acidobacteriota bacterium]